MDERTDQSAAPVVSLAPDAAAGGRWIRGVLFKLTSAFMFTVMAALVRAVGDRTPTGEVVFARSFFALAPLFVWLWWRGGVARALRTSRPFGHLVRGAIGVCAMFCNFAGLARLPLADATALGYAAPLMTTLLAALLLGERIHSHRWTAVGVGIVGVVIILWPQLASGALMAALTGSPEASETAIGVSFALGAAFSTGLSAIQLRRLAQTEGSGVIVFYFSMFSAVLGLASSVVLGWVWPDALTAVLLIVIGVVGGVGQILLTESYRHADASLIAPFDYTTILWAILIGYVLFGDFPSIWTVGGGALVIVSGAVVFVRERRMGLQRVRVRKASPPSPGA